jgi:hypothetical protein
MTTRRQAEDAKDKLKAQLGDDKRVNGIGLSWDDDDRWCAYLILLAGADTSDLVIPTEIDGVTVKTEHLPRATAQTA